MVRREHLGHDDPRQQRQQRIDLLVDEERRTLERACELARRAATLAVRKLHGCAANAEENLPVGHRRLTEARQRPDNCQPTELPQRPTEADRDPTD